LNVPVFISHAMKDEVEFARLTTELDQAGIARWDPQSMLPGQPLPRQLMEGIKACGACVFLATRRSVESHWVGAELGAFWKAGKKVVVFLADPTLRSYELPPQFQNDLAATDVAGLVKALTNPELQDPISHSGTIVFMPPDSQDEEKRQVIRRALTSTTGSDAIRPFREVSALSDLDYDELARWKGIFLGMPYHQTLSDGLIERLVAWVRRGGRLVVSGFELGERHHETNLNQLTYHFGIAFNSDVVVGPEIKKTGTDKDFHRKLEYSSWQSPNDPLLDGVRTITMMRACSLHLEPGARPLVLVRPNTLRELTVRDGTYSSPPAFKLASGGQTFEESYLDDRRALMAFAPEGLTLDGRVLCMGSWDFRSDAVGVNDAFLQNVWRWLQAGKSH
jgi:TIR domain